MKSISRLSSASNVLANCPRITLGDVKTPTALSWHLKAEYLLSLPICSQALKSRPWLRERMITHNWQEQVCLYSLAAIGQTHLFDVHPLKIADGEKKWRVFLDCLLNTETLYADIGGILGYQERVLKLLEGTTDSLPLNCRPAPSYDWSARGPRIESAVRAALERWHQTALILPAGGAGDRLNLIDPVTHQPLPAAFLQLDGKSMLESILRDLRGCEHLVFKTTGRVVETPIAIMTSREKGNHDRILEYLREHRWFGRSKENFRLFSQPSVPVITTSGHWASTAPFELITKPGGHGVLWRLARWSGAFDWLFARNCQKAIVRQINNPLAGSDIGLLALAGLGWQLGKPLGFASCARKAGTAEGVNALLMRKAGLGFTCAIENIEYTQFPPDLEARAQKEPFSANVNLLFVDLQAMKTLSLERPLPGLTINFKSRVKYLKNARWVEEAAGRLESTMQNISHYLTTYREDILGDFGADQFPQFATYGERLKSLTAAKRAPLAGAISETPMAAYLDLQRNYYQLLKTCGFELPFCDEPIPPSQPPPALVALHPALGPDHAVIAQKLIRGSLQKGSELRLEIAELECQNVHVKGSLIVECLPSDERLSRSSAFAELQGRCTLRDICVENDGPATPPAEFWSQAPSRLGALHILLRGRSEFCAEGVSFRANQRIEVPTGHKMTAVGRGDDVVFELQELDESTWHWAHRFEKQGVLLARQEACAPQKRVESAALNQVNNLSRPVTLKG